MAGEAERGLFVPVGRLAPNIGGSALRGAPHLTLRPPGRQVMYAAGLSSTYASLAPPCLPPRRILPAYRGCPWKLDRKGLPCEASH